MTLLPLPARQAARVALLAMLPGALAAQSFEGVITVHSAAKEGGKPAQQVIQVKGARWRMDTDMGGGGTIIGDGEGRVTVVMPARKMWGRPPMLQMTNGEALGDYSFTATGKKDRVLDYECEYYDVKNAASPNERRQWCITGALGFSGIAPVRQLTNSPVLRKAFPKGFFALKAVDGKGDVLYEVVRIEKKSLPDASFAPPPDYKEMPMGGMPGRPGPPNGPTR